MRFELCGLKPVEDKYRQLHSEQVGSGDVTYRGGIDIDEAKRRLQQEDSIDKQLYRDRIQEKHRVGSYFLYSLHFTNALVAIVSSLLSVLFSTILTPSVPTVPNFQITAVHRVQRHTGLTHHF